MAEHDPISPIDPNRLTRLARPMLADPPIAPTPLAEIRRRAARRARQRVAALAVAVVVVLAVGGTALARAGREAPVKVGTTPGTGVQVPDVRVWMDRRATSAQIASVQAMLLADPAVVNLVYSDQAADYAQFRCYFGRQPRSSRASTRSTCPPSSDSTWSAARPGPRPWPTGSSTPRACSPCRSGLGWSPRTRPPSPRDRGRAPPGRRHRDHGPAPAAAQLPDHRHHAAVGLGGGAERSRWWDGTRMAKRTQGGRLADRGVRYQRSAMSLNASPKVTPAGSPARRMRSKTRSRKAWSCSPLSASSMAMVVTNWLRCSSSAAILVAS